MQITAQPYDFFTFKLSTSLHDNAIISWLSENPANYVVLSVLIYLQRNRVKKRRTAKPNELPRVNPGQHEGVLQSTVRVSNLGWLPCRRVALRRSVTGRAADCVDIL